MKKKEERTSKASSLPACSPACATATLSGRHVPAAVSPFSALAPACCVCSRVADACAVRVLAAVGGRAAFPEVVRGAGACAGSSTAAASDVGAESSTPGPRACAPRGAACPRGSAPRPAATSSPGERPWHVEVELVVAAAAQAAPAVPPPGGCPRLRPPGSQPRGRIPPLRRQRGHGGAGVRQPRQRRGGEQPHPHGGGDLEEQGPRRRGIGQETGPKTRGPRRCGARVRR